MLRPHDPKVFWHTWNGGAIEGSGKAQEFVSVRDKRTVCKRIVMEA